MSKRHVRHLRRAGAATLMAAALALTATACGGDDEGDMPSSSSSSSSQDDAGQQNGDSGDTSDANAGAPVATVKGGQGIDMVIQEAKRDSGGFVTVNGEFKNTSGTSFTIPIQWNGQEEAVAAAGNSIAAMTLVDSHGKKRYYVLRDTDNRPLTTVGYEPSIAPGASLPFFAQFPAPPTSAKSVELEFPGFPSTSIEIS